MMVKQARVLIPLTLLALFCSTGATLHSKTKVTRTHEWQEAEEKADNAVVQVIATHTMINWLEPYKAPKQKESSGSAFFIDNKGRLLTNFHVVEGAKSLQVYIPELGQKPVDANIIGVCPEADVALIELSDEGLAAVRKIIKNLPFLTLGDSDSLFPTEPVLALGYPLGQRYIKSTVGVVAGREYIDGRSYMHITAPINPGNSGGPLLNLEGQVVGINTAGIPNASNIGFIVPSYYAKILLKDLSTTKLVRKPNLGIRYNTTTDEHAKLLGNPLPAGVYINTVDLSSVACNAGLKSGDMIYSINGYQVDSYGDVTVNWPSSAKVTLDEFFVRLPLNEKLSMEIYRAGKKKLISCTLTAPEQHPIRFIYPDYEKQDIDFEIIGGMCVMQLRLNHFDYFERLVSLQEYRLIDNQHKEVLIITKLLPGSTVHKIGCFYEGAILAEVNGKAVKNLADLRAALIQSATTGIIALTSKEKIATAISLDTMLKEEERITRDFMFSSTKAIKDLKKLRADVLGQKAKKKK